MSARLLLAVVTTAVAFGVPEAGRADDADTLRNAVAAFESLQWKVTKVVPGADGVSGSILVTRLQGDGFSTDSMWLGLGGRTPFTLNGRSKGIRVSDIQVGMTVKFEYTGIAKTLPPKAVGLTAVHVFGKEKNAEFSDFRDRLEKRVPALK
jgi:hypothetical protein